MSELAIGLVLVGGACGFVGMVISLICVACVVGFLRSTHKIQYVPLHNEGQSAVDEVTSTAPVPTEEDEELKKVGKKRSVVLQKAPNELSAEAKNIISEANSELDSVTQSDFLN